MYNYKITFFDHLLLLECPILYGILPFIILLGLDYINWYVTIIILILWCWFIYTYYIKFALSVLLQDYTLLTINFEEKYILLKKWVKIKKINFSEISSFQINTNIKATSRYSSIQIDEVLIILLNNEKYSIYISPSEELISLIKNYSFAKCDL